MPSVSHSLSRLAAPAVCGLLLIGAASGCSTTQEKAEHQKARADHILKARAERKAQKRRHEAKQGKSDDGSQK